MEKFKKSRNLFIWWGEKRFHELQNILIQMIVQEESDLVHSMIKLTHYENFVEDMKYQYSNELSHRKHPVEVFKLSPMLQFSEVMLVCWM